MGLDVKKPFFGVFSQVRLKPVCSATETSQSVQLQRVARIVKFSMPILSESE